jgi:hypothetical protein
VKSERLNNNEIVTLAMKKPARPSSKNLCNFDGTYLIEQKTLIKWEELKIFRNTQFVFLKSIFIHINLKSNDLTHRVKVKCQTFKPQSFQCVTYSCQ